MSHLYNRNVCFAVVVDEFVVVVDVIAVVVGAIAVVLCTYANQSFPYNH